MRLKKMTWYRLFIPLLVCLAMHGSVLPDTLCNVREFGAAGNGIALDTDAIQKAVDHCALRGGTVLLPAGTYLSGTVFLKSNITLHIADGAVLLGSTDPTDYPDTVAAIPSYNDDFFVQSLLYGESLENIAITGRGTIDGQGGAFPVTTRERPERYRNRPFILRLISSRNILVEDVTMRNSASWMQHYFGCENLIIRGIKVFNHANQNNDMIDIDGCRNVVITDVLGDTDDDGITLKSTSGLITENVTIANSVISSHVNAIKMGTESHGGFRNIVISNVVIKPSTMEETIYGVHKGTGGISLMIVDGGILDGVTISNVRIDGPLVPIYIRLGDRGRTYKPGMERPPVGIVRNVSISDILATNIGNYGASITGLPGHPVENISLRNIRIHYEGGGTVEDAAREVPQMRDSYPEGTKFGRLPAYGLYIRHADTVSLDNVVVTYREDDMRPAFVAEDVRNLDMYGVRARGEDTVDGLIRFHNVRDGHVYASRPLSDVQTFIHVSGPDTRGLHFVGSPSKRYRELFSKTSDVPSKEISVK
jgi:polygalacturonase